MNNDIKVTIEKFDVDWLGIKNMARGTISMADSKIEPTEDWKRKILMAEHSVLRHSLITIKVENIPYCNMGHFVRHSCGVTPYISTSREDRTGTPRDERKQTDPVTMRLDLNIQSIINISRKRICNQSDPTTRKIWYMVVKELAKYDKNIAWACVPEGIHMACCPESFGNCNYCTNFLQTLDKQQLLDLRERLNAYNEYRNGFVFENNSKIKK